MRALDRKLLRDLWGLRGQALAIALVITAGLASVIMSLATLDSLRETRTQYYRDYGFPEVFASLKRAPLALAARIAEIPGVAQVRTRVVAPANLIVEGFAEPVSGRLISVPDTELQGMNRLYLREGRMLDPLRSDEVLVSEVFAEAHGLRPGDRLSLIVNGRKDRFTIAGIVLSPEYVFQIGPGAVFPDFKRFGVLWMGRRTLERAFDMEGAFNDVTLNLTRGAREADVIDRLDNLLEPYGGLGAYGREDQPSHHFLSEEFKGLKQMASTFSAIFLGVSVFLINLVMGRLVNTQREQIAALKAFGYGNLAVGTHYGKLAVSIVLIGVVGGLVVGLWLGQWMSATYQEYYRFPYLAFELRAGIVLGAGLVTVAAALFGTAFAVRQAVRLPPAEAMRPEPPQVYRATVVERLGLQRWLSQPSRMILRHLERRPVKALLTMTGMALASGIMISGTFFLDAMDYMVEAEFGLAQREDIAVSFFEPASHRAVHELASLPGVTRAEPFRAVPVRLRTGHHSHRTSLLGLTPDALLHRTLDTDLKPIALPEEGVVLTEFLAGMLGVQPGDRLWVEALEGRRPVRQVRVAGVVRQYIGVAGYMRLEALNRLMREGPAISGAYLAVDESARDEVYARLKDIPRVAGTELHDRMIESYYATLGDFLLTFIVFMSGLAGAITFGVVYNSARITLAERSRELASLRVLGLTRGEISYILLGELGLLTLLSIPLGFVVGYGLSWRFVQTMQQELFRVPLVLEPPTYALAAAVVLISAVISGLVVRRRLDRLDLIAVLKTTE